MCARAWLCVHWSAGSFITALFSHPFSIFYPHAYVCTCWSPESWAGFVPSWRAAEETYKQPAWSRESFPLSLFLSSPLSPLKWCWQHQHRWQMHSVRQTLALFFLSCLSLPLFSISCFFFFFFPRSRWTYFFASVIFNAPGVCIQTAASLTDLFGVARAKYTSLYQRSGNMNYTTVLIC